MRVITKLKLSAFWAMHPAAERALRTWLEAAGQARWQQPQDIKRWHVNASFLAGNRVVFKIDGNAYRLVVAVAVAYRYGVVHIKFIGTHAQYDAVDAANLEPKQ
jgi:mRNA interferase HigB